MILHIIWTRQKWNIFDKLRYHDVHPEGTPISNGYGCKGHTSKGWGISWEHSLKKEGSLGEKPNFGSKLGGIGWECYLRSFTERFKIRNLQKSSKMAKMICRNGGLWVRAIEESPFHQKMWGLWVTAETISKNMGSLGDSNAENMGSLEPYIRVTSKMGVPPPMFNWHYHLSRITNFLLTRAWFINSLKTYINIFCK